MSGPDIADALEQMKAKGRFRELLFIVDTCQAATLFEGFRTPDVVAVGSSLRSESSYSLTHDSKLGVAVIDRFTFYLLRYFESNGIRGSLENLFKSFQRSRLMSTAFWSSTLSRPLNKVPASDFFGAVLDVAESNSTQSSISELLSASPPSEEEDKRRLLYDEDAWGVPLPLYS